MKKLIQTLTFIFLVSSLAFSQANYESWSWANEYGVPNDWSGYEIAKDVVTDSDGNIYVTGIHHNTFDIGTITLTNTSGYYAIFIAKYSAEGDVIWANSYGNTTEYSDESKRMAIDENNNIYIAGGFGSTTLDFGNGVVMAHTGDAYIAKFNSDGQAQWAVNVETENNLDYSYSKAIAVDETGVYFTGDFGGTYITIGDSTFQNQSANDLDGFFAKYDFDGNFQWAQHFYGDGDEWVFGIAAGNGGETAIVGKFNGPDAELVFGNGVVLTHAPGNFQELFIVKYDSNGNALWAKSANPDNNEDGESAESVAIDNCGNVYVTGDYSAQTISFDDFTVTNTAFGQFTDKDLYWVKLNKDGETQWLGAQGNGKDIHVGGIDLDNTQSPVVYGGVHSNGSIQLGDSTYNNLSNVYFLAYTARLDKETGEMGWNEIARDFEGANDFWYSFIPGVHVDNDGNLAAICHYFTYISGYGATFNLGGNEITGFGSDDFAVGVIPLNGTYSTENDITAFVLAEQTGEAIINYENHYIDIEVGVGTDVSNLLPEIALSDFAYLCTEFTDFTDPVIYTVIAESGTEQDWFVAVDIATGINEIKNQISIYPNPSTGIVFLNLTGFHPKNTSLLSLEIIDFTGGIIYTKGFVANDSRIRIDLSNHPKGVYVIKYHNHNNGILSYEKIIIQ